MKNGNICTWTGNLWGNEFIKKTIVKQSFRLEKKKEETTYRRIARSKKNKLCHTIRFLYFWSNTKDTVRPNCDSLSLSLSLSPSSFHPSIYFCKELTVRVREKKKKERKKRKKRKKKNFATSWKVLLVFEGTTRKNIVDLPS